jgi:hypothetical protein
MSEICLSYFETEDDFKTQKQRADKAMSESGSKLDEYMRRL